jgi:hypothetical protein
MEKGLSLVNFVGKHRRSKFLEKKELTQVNFVGKL